MVMRKRKSLIPMMVKILLLLNPVTHLVSVTHVTILKCQQNCDDNHGQDIDVVDLVALAEEEKTTLPLKVTPGFRLFSQVKQFT